MSSYPATFTYMFMAEGEKHCASLLTIVTRINEAGCEPSKIILLSSGGDPYRMLGLWRPLWRSARVGLQANGSLQFVLFSLPRPGKGSARSLMHSLHEIFVLQP